jgi:hypothetical protein
MATRNDDIAALIAELNEKGTQPILLRASRLTNNSER